MPPSPPPSAPASASATQTTTSTPTKRSRRPSFLLSRTSASPPVTAPQPAPVVPAPPTKMNLTELREKERERERHKLARGLLVKKSGAKTVKKVVLVEGGDVFGGGKAGGEGGCAWTGGANGEKRVEVGELVVVLTPPEETHLPSSTIFPCASPPPPKQHPFSQRPRHHPPPPRRSSTQPPMTVIVRPAPPPPPKVVIHPATGSPAKAPPAPASPPPASPASTDGSPKTIASSAMSSPEVPFEFDDSSSATTSVASPPRPAMLDGSDVDDEDGDGEVEEMVAAPSSPPRRPESPTPTKHHAAARALKHAAKPSHSSISSEDSSTSEEGVVMRGFVVTPQSPIAMRAKVAPAAVEKEATSSYTSPPSTPTSPAKSSSGFENSKVDEIIAAPVPVVIAPVAVVLPEVAPAAPLGSPTKSKVKAKSKDTSSPTRSKSVTTPMARRPSLGGRISSDVSDAIRGFARMFPPPPLPTSPGSTDASPASPTKRRLPFQQAKQPSSAPSTSTTFPAPRGPLPENPPLEFDSGLGRPRPRSVVAPGEVEEPAMDYELELKEKEKKDEKERTLQSKRSTKSFKRFFLSSSPTGTIAPPLPVVPALPLPAATPKRPSPAPLLFTPPAAATTQTKRRSRSATTSAPSPTKEKTTSTTTAPKDPAAPGGRTLEKRFSVASLSAAFSSGSKKAKAAAKERATAAAAVAPPPAPEVPEVPREYRLHKAELAAIVVASPPRPSAPDTPMAVSPLGVEAERAERVPTELDTAGGSIRESETVERELERECRERRGVVRESGSLGTVMSVGGEEDEAEVDAVESDVDRDHRRRDSQSTVVGGEKEDGEKAEGGEGMAPEMTRGPSASSTTSTATLSYSPSLPQSHPDIKHPSQSPTLPSNPSFPTHPSLHPSQSQKNATTPTQEEFNSMALQLKLRSLHFAPLGLNFGEEGEGMGVAV